jgi:hypothetical protein
MPIQGSMNYHHRYVEDGSCEVICTHCFLTIGVVKGLAAVKELEGTHICSARASMNGHLSQPSPDISSPKIRRFPAYADKIASLSVPLLFIAIPLLLYALPTAIEIVLLPHIGPWLTSIVFGDLVACACIFAVFRMRRTGLILYLLLMISKACLYSAHIIPANMLVWITDLIPALIVMAKIASLKFRPAAQMVRSQ